MKNYRIKYIISSKLEHLSIINILKNLKKDKKGYIQIIYIKNDSLGQLNLSILKKIIKKKTNYNYNILISLMYINNEIGNINNIEKIYKLSKKYKVLYHSDFVQYIGHYKLNFLRKKCDFFTASSHKFYGPLGVGFIYKSKKHNLKNFINGGNQEQNIRSGTENLYGIVGMSKALKIFYNKYENEKKYILKLKKYCIYLLKKYIDNIRFNGLSDNLKKSSYNILNIRLPFRDDLLHIKLDLKKIMISKGSSCYYQTNLSHVIKNILKKEEYKKTTSIRVSFSIYNKKEEIDYFVNILKKINYDKKISYN
ncbi:MAG: aminotransferase class V-fold PLP-dependent enzyme [Candidatus Shikimatogenerans bostrichidophilus]|nr:MAG: aminotransferase class V-fold PLP-dependent enzyme [Candidatus Shikimatogenerans bostrichidophilus]